MKINIAPCSNVRNNHFFKAKAITESSFANTCHTARNSNGGKTFAIIERHISNTRHTISNIIIIDCLWNNNTAFVIIGVTCYFCNLCFGN